MPKVAPLLLALLLALPAWTAFAQEGAPSAPVVAPPRIAIIDSGIRADHPEFDAGQVVAWWAFTREGRASGSLNPYDYSASQRSWDPHSHPFDLDGHGTATASLAAGHNRGACGATPRDAKLSFAPGAELIVAKVTSQDETRGTIVDGDLGLAIRWAVDQGADVISISIGSIAPVPLHYDESALAFARSRGVLVVVSAGNGLANTGLAPFPTWSTSYGNSKSVLAVSGGGRDASSLTSLTGNLDPDVVAWSDGVCIASLTGGYRKASGTSFSAPLVAGMAAQAMAIARAHGANADDEHIERLLLYAATNEVRIPYAREGMGYLGEKEWPLVAGHAATGALPDIEAQGWHATADLLYHDVVIERARNVPFL